MYWHLLTYLANWNSRKFFFAHFHSTLTIIALIYYTLLTKHSIIIIIIIIIIIMLSYRIYLRAQ